MSRITNNSIVLFSLAACLAIASPADAKPGEHGKGMQGKNPYESEEHHSHGHGKDDDDKILIKLSDRGIIEDWLDHQYGRGCPPGLAKKHNGCTPPGLAKKWGIGRALPDDVVFYPLPGDLLGRLSPAPVGYRYVRVDRDVLLMSEATKHVLDAITLYSAVGQ